MSNIVTLEKLKDDTRKKTKQDYHVPVLAPYTKEHQKINEIVFCPDLKPEYFDLHHLGLDYDCHNILDAEVVHEVSAKQDKQKQRFKQNKKRPDIKESVSSDGKDIRCKPVFIVKKRNKDNTISYIMILDGNTFVDIGKEYDIPNYLVAEFWVNSKWSKANAIAIGVYLNLLEKPFGAAEQEDVRHALIEISKTDEFKNLMKDAESNFSIISEKLTNYYFKMSKKTVTNIAVQTIINDIIYEDNSVKKQNINPTRESITKQLKDAGFVDNSSTIYSVYANYPEKTVTSHLRTRISLCPYPSTRVGVVLYTSGSRNHNPNWWIVESYKMISEIESYEELHEGSKAFKRFFIAAVYQNHDGTDHKFEVGSFVHPEEIKVWYKQLKDNDEI